MDKILELGLSKAEGAESLFGLNLAAELGRGDDVPEGAVKTVVVSNKVKDGVVVHEFPLTGQGEFRYRVQLPIPEQVRSGGDDAYRMEYPAQDLCACVLGQSNLQASSENET